LLAVAGDKKMIEFFLIIDESTSNFQMSKEVFTLIMQMMTHFGYLNLTLLKG
jgi:hypothetical protein